MEDLGMEEGKKPEGNMTSAAAFVVGGIQDACDDVCSICLEEFCESDPSTVTNCKHEFHLQCVLECQELLEAVERERRIRANPPRNATIFHPPTLGDFELQHLPVGSSDPDLEECILQHLIVAAAMGRAHHFGKRETHRTRSAAESRPHFFVFSAGPVARGGETGPATPAVANQSPPLSSTRDDSSQHILQFHPIQTDQNSAASGSAVAQANRHTKSQFPRVPEGGRRGSSPATLRCLVLDLNRPSRLMEHLKTRESNRGSHASASSHSADRLVTEQNNQNNTETRGESPLSWFSS